MNKIIITSAITLALSLSACSEQKTAEQLIASANLYSQQGKFSNAIIDYKNAVRLAPQSAEARLGLGQTYLNQGNYISAEKELDRAVELGISYAQAATLLAQVKTRLDKFEEVEQLVKLSEELNDNDYLTVLSYAGMAMLANGQVAKAQDYFSQAAAILPESAYSKLSQVYLIYIERDFAQGLPIINNLLTEQGTFSEASLLQGYLHFALTDYEQAIGSFTQYLASYPLDHNIRFFLADSQIKAGKYEQATVITDSLLKLFKDSPLALQFKAQLEYQNKNYSEARNYANKAIHQDEDAVIVRLISGVSSYHLNDIEQAYTHLRAIDKYLPNTHPVKKILNVAKLKLGYYAETAESLSELQELTPDDVNLLAATTANLISIGELDSALALIDKSKQLPRNSKIPSTEAEVIQQNEQRVDNELALAIEYLKQDENTKAQQIADELKSALESKYLGLLLQGIIYVKHNDQAKAAQNFEQVLLLKPENIASLFNLGLLKQKNNQHQAALAFYKRVLAISNVHLGTLKNLISLANNEKMVKDVIELLSAHEYQDSLKLTIALAQSLRINNKIAESIIVLEQISTEVKLTSSYYMVLGDSYLQKQDVMKSNIAYSQGLIIEPQSLLLNVRYIGTLSSLKKYPQALVQARKAYSYYKESDRISVLLTYLEAKNNNVIQAKEMLAKLKNKQVSHHLLDMVTGEIALYEKKYQEAVDAFSSAYELKADQINLISLARALKLSGQANEAEKLLEKFIEKHPENEQVRLLLVSLYSEKDHTKKIIQYLSLSKSSPGKALIFNNLAWFQYKAGQVKAALKNIEKAKKLQGDSLAIQESYGVILIANDEFTKGILALENALNRGSVSTEVKEKIAEAMALVKRRENEKKQ
ncbi:PEP-CTERM system TPR-repeat protein PrsT [Colwellia sp. 75C3]|uniref:XrtA/PEP-CTERM system TPR-repeat protein PrsT n=1 Tax=Colwellia sp. 75C3 TaxID=888425 RepID=UPI000C34DAA5|nr:XrtA/PEP-CTERM system TPR-repeat protein PrsT [Colwellia sp. 75C3]PKG81594.1 PEP-CTERM system TPR-repeat protein PrsT [Colwellia sp. 75C3]